MVKKLNKTLALLNEHNQFFLRVVLALSFVFLSACSSRNTPEGIFDNYHYRLHNSLDIQSPKITVDKAASDAISKLPRYPQRKALLYTLNESSINLLDFLRLSQCDLQRHIGERNSSLGKLQKDSQRLIYDIEFIRLAKLCIDELPADNPLRNLLEKATQNKQEQLSLLLWNATFASEEFSYLFSLSTDYLSAKKPAPKPIALYEAIESIARMIDENENLSGIKQSDLEAALALFASSKHMGEVRRSMALVTESLSLADELLRQRLNQRPLCRNDTPNAQFDIVNNVFRKFYIGEVQPYIAAVYQQAQTSIEALDNLAKLQTVPVAYDDFWSSVYSDKNSEWQQLTRAIKLHTENWQALLTQCGSMPS